MPWILLEADDLFQNQTVKSRREGLKNYPDGLEANAFKGIYGYFLGEEKPKLSNVVIEFHAHSKATGRTVKAAEYLTACAKTHSPNNPQKTKNLHEAQKNEK